ncbi:unnamed protein product [Bursaphelenchus okinawaensis]|uniref:G-protein coupled receptors family 1 profile domain-containing protein n=1 Tax=Bursaphelenchus okinawaensis TaxID=465554 RepID=A0A811K5J6_9BILA|nr:unnamed protein product [Bursaphelenchus okinawaensis]CAG9093017.1 unnamed protein product [Bursaphelenchus okinawaensis]
MSPQIVVYAVFELLLALQIAVSNALVIWVYITKRPVRTPTNTYMFSLALTDFLAGAVGVPVTVFSVITRAPHSFESCLFVHLILCILCTVSTFHLLVIAIDKYLTICCQCQFWMDQNARHFRARILIVFAWILGTVIGLLPLFDVFEFSSRNRHRFHGECHFTLVVDYRYLVYVIFFTTIIVPSLIIFSCYTAIYRRIGLEEKQIKCLLRASERRRRMRNRRKLIRTLTLLVCTYALCWFPLYLLNTVDFFFPDRESHLTMTLFAVVLSHANCALNPVIYAYGMPGFKHTLRRFMGIKTMNKPPIMIKHAIPHGKCSMASSIYSQHNTPYKGRKKYSWTQLGRSLESIDGSLSPGKISRPALNAINEK